MSAVNSENRNYRSNYPYRHTHTHTHSQPTPPANTAESSVSLLLCRNNCSILRRFPFPHFSGFPFVRLCHNQPHIPAPGEERGKTYQSTSSPLPFRPLCFFSACHTSVLLYVSVTCSGIRRFGHDAVLI